MQITGPSLAIDETIIEQQECIEKQRGIIAKLRKGIDDLLPTREFTIAERDGAFFITRVSWLHPIVGPKVFEFNSSNEAEFLLIHLLQNDRLRDKAMGYLGISECSDEDIAKATMKFLLEQKPFRKIAKEILKEYKKPNA